MTDAERDRLVRRLFNLWVVARRREDLWLAALLRPRLIEAIDDPRGERRMTK